jgi:hypothetical protein
MREKGLAFRSTPVTLTGKTALVRSSFRFDTFQRPLARQDGFLPQF